jgi:hypothetical protein
MRLFLILVSVVVSISVFGQKDVTGIVGSTVKYHEALVNKDYHVIDLLSHKKLKYAHSNGWVETKKEQVEHLKTGYLEYFSIAEDSMKVTIMNRLATVYFIAKIDVAVKGDRKTYLLQVAEIWKKKGKHYLIIGRKAAKYQSNVND